MKKALLKITVGGVEYPCRSTMGAMLRFKRETGREVTELDARSVSDLALWLWCCVSSACSADGVTFGLSLQDFADRLSAETLRLWSESQRAEMENGGDAGADVKGEKKTRA